MAASTIGTRLSALICAPMSSNFSLSEHECALLDFEREAWTLEGPKESNIRSCLAISPTKYYRTLSALVDGPAAFAYDPLTTMRLRRSREERRRTRIEGRRADRGRS